MIERNSCKRYFMPFIALMLMSSMSLSSQEAPTFRHLFEAIEAENLEDVRRIIRLRPELLHSVDILGSTPLQDAVIFCDHLAVIRFLLQAGAYVDAKDSHGNTALHAAAEEGNIASLLLLLSYNARVNARNDSQWSPFHAAVYHGNIQASNLLLRRGADSDACNSEMWMPLHFAAAGGTVGCVEFLVDHGVLSDPQDNDGKTPLLLALDAGWFKVVSWLLKFGVPLELGREICTLNQRAAPWVRLRKIIQDRKQEIDTVLLDNELPLFSDLAPEVISIIIDYMVTPELPA